MPVRGAARRAWVRAYIRERRMTLRLESGWYWMTDLVMLICAAIGSMAFGVLLAYVIFRAVFALMRPRRKPVPVNAQAEAAGAL